MSAKIIFISIMAALVALFFIVLHRGAIPAALVCTSKYHLDLDTQKNGIKIKGEVLQVFRISSEKDGMLSQVGVLDVNDKQYTVNRTTSLRFLEKDSDGYLRTERLAIVKNDNDDLPDAITDLLMSKQKMFYYKVIHIDDNVYSIRDLRRTLMVCRAK
ncbi:hypothetical protein [Enterobacter huaxiensis]|uniref:FidL-like membrane protein n=1 Tax=Enterobacter huaxiensis TaxID=2494702 RepID=A0ABU6EQF4_9ENTR|nr:hypothetical protein [Enterobacter huaxiensis]MEB7543303.1 hypothetical protein [Enterobacter huaxiensis]MEB7579667.1 hypothetical protein [Enterobacter huaxiensis]MEB7662135.1 hypothetical protein [Enterobacter huaxiensis]